MNEKFYNMTPEQEAELKERHKKVVEEVKFEEEIRNKALEKQKLIYTMTSPETYADIAMNEITNNPEAFKPEVMRTILIAAVSSAMDVWSHGGHLLYITKEDTVRCINCGKTFKKENIPQTALCSTKRRKK